ncbi:hypothetical protein [Rhizohabitans arisaemae]|uniref:hypothetical protein n=1 Tax=Rhizohabitans arisaemae TaxID=2720610 RepID=UPI0024B05D47|nr:hypothetical protein [Rhizohabitans arisaemae]
MSSERHGKPLVVAQVLLWIAAAAALASAVFAIAQVSEATASTKVVETWRMVGLATFAALFASLARRPRGRRTLWAVVIANKLLLTVAGAVYTVQGGVDGATDILVFDGGLTLLLVAAFALAHTGSRAQAADDPEPAR